MSSLPRKKSEMVDLKPGEQVGVYRIERELGSGGMADVYYAIHTGLERPLALKILRPSLATDEVHLQRFLQEARAAASLVHPNIVQVYDVGQSGDLRYIAQEYIPGSNLRQYLARRPGDSDHRADADNSQQSLASGEKSDRQLAIREVLSILLQILAALNKSAASGIVHRDIKPENIMLTPEGDVKVADFGLARLLMGDDPQLTRAGTTLGTPMYMSPEQIQEGQVDIRSDLYSLGVTLYHMLSGGPPFTGETPLALAMQHVQATVPDLRRFREDIPDSLLQLVQRLLAKDPADRFDNPQRVLEYLREYRKLDLADDWPDQTMPLPGAALLPRAGPMSATLVLQSKLRARKNAWMKGIARILTALAAMCLAFFAGNALTYESPWELLASPSGSPSSITPKDSVQEQYRSALFDTQSNRISKWEAVELYFPREERDINRLYAGLADLQLARVHHDDGDPSSAHDKLNRILQDVKMQSVVKAFAYLELAKMEDAQQNNQEMQNALKLARQIRDGNGFNAKDRNQLDAAVGLMSSSAQMLWFGVTDS